MSDQKLAQFRENLSELKLIIIDEMSLLNADMLYKIHLRLTEIFIDKRKELFGGIGLVLVGDLLQLPPVKGKYIFERPMNEHFSAYYDANPLWTSFEPFLLKHNHRQGALKDWADSLNRIREGAHTEEDEMVLQKRLTQEPFLNENAMHVFYTNKEVHDHNIAMLNKITSAQITFDAIHVTPKGYSPKVTSHGTVQSTQFQDKLQIKIGARCMLIFNINTIDELVNGATGRVVGFERGKKMVKNPFDCIIVSFDDETCGQEQRKKYPAISEKYKGSNGTPIFRYELEYQLAGRAKHHSAKAKVIQFPLRVCYASTAHKMQVIIDIVCWIFEQ